MIKFIIAMISKANRLVVQTYLVRIIHRVRKDEPGTYALMVIYVPELKYITNWKAKSALYRGQAKYLYVPDPATKVTVGEMKKYWKEVRNG